MGAFWCKLRNARKTSTRAMNTSSLQKMKMAARMSCLPSQNPIKMRISPIKLQGGMVVPRMVATSEKKCPAGVSERPSKAIKVHGLKILKKLTNFVDEHFELVFPLQLHFCLHGYPQFSQNELVLVSLVPCHSLKSRL